MNGNNEIDLLDLVKRIIKKWKLVVVFIFAGALVMNGIGILKSKEKRDSYKKPVVDTKAEEKIEHKYEDKLALYEIEEVKVGVQAYLSIMDNLSDTMKYNEESLIMSLDANAVPTVRLQYYVDAYYQVEYPVMEKTDDSLAIVSAYINSVDTMDMPIYVELAETIGVSDAKYVKELINPLNMDNGTFIIDIYADSEENCDAIADVVDEYIREQKDEIGEIYDEYDITLVSRGYFVDVNTELLYVQQNQLTMIGTLKNASKNITASFTDEQGEYYKELINQKLEARQNVESDEFIGNESEVLNETTEEEPFTVSATPKIEYINFKNIILGGLFGFVFCCCIIVVQYLYSGTVKRKEDFNSMFNLSLLGSIVTGKNNIKTKGPQFTEEERVSMICASIYISAKKNDLKDVYITGSCNDDETERVKELIYVGLKNKKLHVAIGNTIVYDAESLEEMSSKDAVVLVERIDYSHYTDISKEVELCEKFGQNLLGVVCVE